MAYNGEQAVDFVKKACQEKDPWRYSLILTDCSMPFMDGYVASKTIRRLVASQEVSDDSSVDGQEQQELRIMAITGHVEPAYIQKAKQHGIDEVFPKPMPVIKLGHILKQMNFIEEIPPHILKNNK